MGGMVGETHYLQLIQNGLTTVRNNVNILADVLDALSPDELTAAQNWFSTPTNKIIVAPGFPMATEQLPYIGVTIAQGGQIAEQTGIGNAYYRQEPDVNGQWVDVKGIRMRAALRAGVYSQNADFVVWLSHVVLWSVVQQLDWLDEQGFNGVQVQISDFEATPQTLPIYAFNRGVYLSSEYDITYKTSPQIITGFQFNSQFTFPNGEGE